MIRGSVISYKLGSVIKAKPEIKISHQKLTINIQCVFCHRLFVYANIICFHVQDIILRNAVKIFLLIIILPRRDDPIFKKLAIDGEIISD